MSSNALSDIERVQKEHGLILEEAEKLFREGELWKVESEQEDDKITVTIQVFERTW